MTFPRAPVGVVLTISRDALAFATTTTPAVGCLADGTGVSAETARRLACDCGVVHLDEGADGQPLSVGRRTRSIPTAIARALARRDTTCRFPGCTNRRFLDGHHLTHWIHGGATSLDNLCRLCSSHHRYVHERGTPSSCATAIRPSSTAVVSSTPSHPASSAHRLACPRSAPRTQPSTSTPRPAKASADRWAPTRGAPT